MIYEFMCGYVVRELAGMIYKNLIELDELSTKLCNYEI